jgi:sugar O-acyltransferase (sialic acid O-acetyltransferase NeuD family)
MIQDLVIIGAGGFGREVAEIIDDINKEKERFNLLGFLDDNEQALTDIPSRYQVIGSTERDLASFKQVNFCIAVGDALKRSSYAKMIAAAGAKIQTIVHPLSKVSPTSTIGAGVVFCPFSYAGTSSFIGENAVLNVYSSVGHDSKVGRDSVISPYVAITGNVHIGDESFIGAHATITPGVSIGKHTKIAAGVTVTRNVEPGSLVWGYPSKSRIMFDA